jgi:hypothetical protein
MKFVAARPYADPERAARKLVEIANSTEAVQDGRICSISRKGYFSELLTDVNIVLRLEPRPFTMAMIASAMPAAIKPYSIAVAPDSSDRNLKT